MKGKFWEAMLDSSQGDVGVPYSVIEKAKKEFNPYYKKRESGGQVYEWFIEYFGEDEL